MSVEELNARDMAIEEQLNFLSKQAAPKELANKPLKIKSEVTKDMVDDFKSEQQGSIFHPPSVLPVLETYHPVAIPGKERISDEKKLLLEDIYNIEIQILTLIRQREQLKEAFNKELSLLDLMRFNKKLELDNERTPMIKEFEEKMEQLDIDIAELEIIKNRIIDKINLLDKTLNRVDELKQENESEKARVERVNKGAIKTFESEMNALNKGININQQVGESDEDYLQRIENMKGARYSQEVIVQAETFNIKRFKTKMKEIMSIPEHKLEKIIKYLEKDNMLYEANKKFPLIKTAIEKTYGVNPRFTKAGDEEDLYMFIYNTLTKQFQEKEETQGLTVESKNADLLAPSKTGFISKLKLLAIYQSMTGKKSFTGSSKQLAEEIIKLREKDESVKPAYAESVRSLETRRTGASRRTDLSKKPFGFTREEPEQEQDLGGFPTPKKRGRPTKAEQEAKAEEAARANLEKSREASSFLRDAVQKAQQTRTKARQEEDYQRVLAATLQAQQAEARADTKRRQEVGSTMADMVKEIEARAEAKRIQDKRAEIEARVSLERARQEARAPILLPQPPPPPSRRGRPKKEIPIDPRQTKIGFAKGKGVEREFYPKLVPFGAIMISPAQLFYYKLLRVRDGTKHSIRGMPDVRVSEDMVHILMKIINGSTPSMTELKALSEDEKTIYDAIIMKAKLHKEMPNTYEQSIQSSINKLKKRLELCEGEWKAGNDNTLIKKELNSIIRQLTELKAISEVDGRKYLKQF